MAVKTPSLPTDQLLHRADEALSTAAGNLGALADKAPDVDIQEEVAASDRRIILAVMVVAAVLALAVVVIARRRRNEAVKAQADT
jgi:hypothetical protein